MKLFKYLPPERIDVLENLRIRFTQPIIFNDPFESNPHIINDFTKERWEKVTTIECERNKLPQKFREHMRNLFSNPQFEDKMQECLEALRVFMASMPLALSLSEKPDDLLMWAHYAKNHEGFVIGFDAEHPVFSGKGKGIYKLTKVHYSAKRPEAGISKLSLDDTYFTKSIDWAYEREWRLFAERSDAPINAGTEDCPIYLFDLPPDTIIEIIWGCRSGEELKSQIAKIAGSKAGLRHVALLRASISETDYKLNISPVSSK